MDEIERILIEIEGKIDPSAFEQLKRLFENLSAQGKTTEQILEKMGAASERLGIGARFDQALQGIRTFNDALARGNAILAQQPKAIQDFVQLIRQGLGSAKLTSDLHVLDFLISNLGKDTRDSEKAIDDFIDILTGVTFSGTTAAGKDVIAQSFRQTIDAAREVLPALADVNKGYEKGVQASQPFQRFAQQIAQAMAQGAQPTVAMAQATKNFVDNAKQSSALGTFKELITKLAQDGKLSAQEFYQLYRAATQLIPVTQRVAGAFRSLREEFEIAKLRETRYEFRQLLLDIQHASPVLGLMIEPLGTIISLIDRLFKTRAVGGLFGGLLGEAGKLAGGLFGGTLRFIEHTMSTAFGFVIGNVLLSPFKLLGSVVGQAGLNFNSFIRDAIKLNSELGKTKEEVEKQQRVWQQFILVLTKPTYDFIKKQLEGIGQAVQKMFTGGAGRGTDFNTFLFSFGAALGGNLERALSFIKDFASKVFSGGGPFDPTVWLRNGARLAGEFARGLTEGFISFVIPAITAVVETVAGFIIGKSPPALGPLRDIVLGGRRVVETWLEGFLQADFSALDQLASLVKSKLDLAVARKQISEGTAIGREIEARDIIAGALAEITTQGSIAEATMQRLAGLFGDTFETIRQYLGAFQELRSAQIAVAAAQDAYNAAAEHARAIQERVRESVEAQQAVIDHIQDAIKDFELRTAEIPERFTRGRRRELEQQLTIEERRLRAIREEGQVRERFAQREEESARKNLEAAQKREQAAQRELNLIANLIKEDEKRNALLAQQAKLKVGIDLPAIDEKLKAKIQKFIEDNIITPFKGGLGRATNVLLLFFQGLAGQLSIPQLMKDFLAGKIGPKEFEAGAGGLRLRAALGELAKPEFLEGLKQKFDSLVDSLKTIADAIRGFADAWNNANDIVKAQGVFTVLFGLPGLLTEGALGFKILGAAVSVFGIVGTVVFAGLALLFGKVGEFYNLISQEAWKKNPFLGFLIDAITLLNPMIALARGVATAIDTIRESLGKLLKSDYVAIFKDLQKTLSGDPSSSVLQLFAGIKKQTDQASTGLVPSTTAISDLFGKMKDSVVGSVQSIFDQLFKRSIIPDIEEGFNGFIQFLHDLRWRAQDAMVGLRDTIINVAFDMLFSFGDWFYAVGQTIWNSLISGLAGAINANPILNILQNALSGITSIISQFNIGGLLGTLSSFIPSLQGGGLVVKSGLAVVHEGETVGAVGGITVINNWPDSIGLADRDRFEEIARRTAERTFKRILNTSKRM